MTEIKSRGSNAGLEQEQQNRLTARAHQQTKEINMADETGIKQHPQHARSAAASPPRATAPAPRTGGPGGTAVRVPAARVARVRRRSRRRPADASSSAARRSASSLEKIDTISYRDVRLLQRFVSERGKIIPRRLTGTRAPFQRKLTRAIKQARDIALLPFAAQVLSSNRAR